MSLKRAERCFLRVRHYARASREGDRVRRVLAVLFVLLAACTNAGGGSSGAPPTASPERLLEFSSTGCPSFADGDSGFGVFALWPDEGARDVVPALDSICATPTSPHLFGVLNEMAGWGAGDLDAAGLGVLHRGHQPVATFFAMRIAEETPGLEEARAQMRASGAALTESGGVDLAWGRAGDHVNVYWLDGRDAVSISAEGRDNAVEAVGLWLDDLTVEAPADIPELGTVPPALEAGVPVAGFPDGYEAIDLNPIAFMASDFADEVTIHEEEGIEALGATVVVHDGSVVGTLVGGVGVSDLTEWADDFAGEPNVAAAAMTSGETSAFVVGDDQRAVDAFVDARKEKLEG